MSRELKPCPFCGSELLCIAHTYLSFYDDFDCGSVGNVAYSVIGADNVGIMQCVSCGTVTLLPLVLGKNDETATRQKLIEHWNNRNNRNSRENRCHE